MKPFCYLSLIPEALIVSALSPEAFALYYATGSQRRSRSQAIFFEVAFDAVDSDFQIQEIERRGLAHADGSPRKSLYLGVYRVLERVPLASLGRLFLATAEGSLLALEADSPQDETSNRKHLYQELAPVTPMVASKLGPVDFGRSVTDPSKAIYLPRLAYCELELGGLAEDPDSGDIEDLPYPHMEHVRDCLIELDAKPSKANKTVLRGMRTELLYRTVTSGFYLAERDQVLYYPMPTRDELERQHYGWWRSAQKVF